MIRYFQPSLPSPYGDLAGAVPPAAIKHANEVVRKAQAVECNARGQYCKISPEKHAVIAQYVLENGNEAAAQFFYSMLDSSDSAAHCVPCLGLDERGVASYLARE